MLTNVMNLTEYIKSINSKEPVTSESTASCSVDGCDSVGPARLFSVGVFLGSAEGFVCPTCVTKHKKLESKKNGWRSDVEIRCTECECRIYDGDEYLVEIVGGVQTTCCRWCYKKIGGEKTHVCKMCSESVPASKFHSTTNTCNSCSFALKKCNDCEEYHFSTERYRNIYLSTHREFPTNVSVGCAPKKVYTASPIMDMFKAEVERISNGMHKPFYFRNLASV